MSRRPRAKNFTEYEKTLLVELIEGKVNIIEEKILTTSTIGEKSKAWDAIVNAFNADEKVNKRDKKNLHGFNTLNDIHVFHCTILRLSQVL